MNEEDQIFDLVYKIYNMLLDIFKTTGAFAKN